MAESLMQQLQQKGYDPATRLLNAQIFWKAEAYHQNYYDNHKPL